MPPVAPPIEGVEVRILYDPFKPEEVETHEIAFVEGQTLSEYLGDLPDGEYMLFLNNDEIDPDLAHNVPVNKGDRIGLIVLPLGGSGLKSVLRVVMQVAMIGVFFIPGLGQLAAAAIALGLGVINAFLMTPKPPKNRDMDDRSYGIDGAKNSATEGIPYPIVYGTFRQAGNFADTYTENVGDNQYLYLRSIVNDGLIDSITDIEVNEQPIQNFRDVQHRIALGSLEQGVNEWFRSSIRQTNKGVKLDTGWTTHITTGEVDQVRFDVTFPAGLVSISEKKGTYRNKSVRFETQYRKLTPGGDPVAGPTGEWQPLPNNEPDIPYARDNFAGGIFNNIVSVINSQPGRFEVEASAQPISSAATSATPAIEYREAGGGWVSLGDVFADQDRNGFVPDISGDGSISGPTNITPKVSSNIVADLPAGALEFRGVNGATVERIAVYPSSGAESFQVTEARTRAIRRSFTSQRLDRGIYELRIRRTTATSTDQYEIDEVILTDIGEIEADPVAMRGTANLSLRIKLNEQLSNIPQLTSKVKGCVLQEYDDQGNPTVKRWSANPAWIALDILCGEQRGAGFSLSRIDWPRWVEYAQWCEANGVEFNGIFAESTNLGDALRDVLRIGRAAPVPFGTKLSIAIDRPRDPVTVFTQASMLEKSFSIAYMSMQDRSNEFEVTYYDKNDRNKAKTIRYVDPKAVTFNEMPRATQVSLNGVDNVAQAKAELWRMIYQNRLLIRTVQFDTFMEAINLSLGEVALIQHDQMEWADSGRIAGASSASVIKLDQPVTMTGGSHSLLVHFSALRRVPPRSVSSVVGNKVLFATGGSALTADQLKSNRLVSSSGLDLEIIKLESGASFHTATLASPPAGLSSGQTVELFQTDVVEERPVSGVAQNADNTTTVTVLTPFSATPSIYANFVFGRVEKVRKPYVLTGVSGNGLETRKLTFVEYNDAVYGPPEVDIPIPVEQVNDRNVSHVTGLLFDYDRIVDANRKTTNVRIFWNASDIRNYGGADIFMRLNSPSFTAIGSASNVSEFNVQLTPGDEVEFKVVAYSTRGDRAPFITAPSVSGTLTVERAVLDPPTEFSAIMSGFEIEGTVAYAFTPPVDLTGVEGYELEVRHVDDVNWFSLGRFNGTAYVQSGVPAGSYIARVRSISTSSSSVWVETTFAVASLPGSLINNLNFTAGNDRNGDPISAPTLPLVGAVEHTLNTDGSANISLEWLWDGEEGDIDGFRITMSQA